MSTLSRRRLLQALGTGAGLALTGVRPIRAETGAPGLDAGTPAELMEEAPDPNDPVAVLYGRRLTFVDGMPLVTVRILEGRDDFYFVPHGAVRVWGRNAELKSAVPNREKGRWRVRVANATPGQSVIRVQVGEHLFHDRAGAEADADLFRQHGYTVSLVSVGSVYGIAGRTVDTRHILVLVEGDGTEENAAKLVAEIGARFGVRPEIHREPVERGRGMIEVFDPLGNLVARGPDALAFEVPGGVVVEKVEYSIGYPDHGFEDRRYPERLFAAIDARGRLAAVSQVPLETLAKGIVPSEIFTRSHMEALKSQAVTARGEILGKVGARHIGDPYLLCAEQHCQVFRGTSGENPRTSTAVDETRGEALFAPRGGPLVPSYYSAICGGHTEDNDKVWGGPPNPSIRGRPDFPISGKTRIFSEGIGEALLRKWLASDVQAFCRTASVAKPDKFRWTRSFTISEVNNIAEAYAVGSVTSLEIDGRGISGRARTLVMKGSTGEARVHTELAIRRLFKMLPSGMFVIDVEGVGDARVFHFRGGGWGHGAGMCQTGAIGRAEQGVKYRDILKAYFSGAEVVRIYS